MSGIWHFFHNLVDQFQILGKREKIIICSIIAACFVGSLFFAKFILISSAPTTQKVNEKTDLPNVPVTPTGNIKVKITQLANTITAGQPFTVSVDVESNGNIYDSGTVVIKYDPDVVHPLGGINGNIFSEMQSADIQKNTVTLSGKYIANVSTRRYDGTLASISFIALRETSGTTLSFNLGETEFIKDGSVIPNGFSFLTFAITP